MASVTFSSGIATSYFVLENWLARASALDEPSETPDLESIKKQAAELQSSTLTFTATYYAERPIPDSIARSLLIIQKVTRDILENSVTEGELKAADFALRLLTPLNEVVQSLNTATFQLDFSASAHEEKIAAVKAVGAAFLTRLSTTASYRSPLMELLAKNVGLAITDLEIESLKATRTVVISETFRIIFEALHNLETFYGSNDLSIPANVIKALCKCQEIEKLCHGYDVEIKDLGDEVQRTYHNLIEQRDRLKVQIFEKYFASTCSLLPEIKGISYSKDQKSILETIHKLSALIEFASTFTDQCRAIFGAYEGPIDIKALNNALLHHMAHLFAGKLECDMTIMEQVKIDFPTLRGLPEERQEQMIAILDTFRDEFRKIQMIGIRSGGLPDEIRERMSAIQGRHSELRSWLESEGIPDESQETATLLRARFRSLASSGSTE